VRFSYPAIYSGVLVEGVELTFSNGKVTQARAEKNQAFLMEMLESDTGARYVGEFAIAPITRSTGFRTISCSTKNWRLLPHGPGRGYPETGSHNKSIIHWI